MFDTRAITSGLRHRGRGPALRRKPASLVYGYDRGQPIDRRYIEAFLERHALAIRGRVLEVGDNDYTIRFGGARVTRSEILHGTPDNPRATIVGNIEDLGHVASESFDCIIFTQTLQCVYDVRRAVTTLHRLLRPGGTLLATFPGITHLPPQGGWTDTWYWSLTPVAARRVFGEVFADENMAVRCHGNLVTATAFLQGLAAEELDADAFDGDDPTYPLVVTVQAMKSPAVESDQVLVSVVIPCYNHGRFLGDAIESVLAQTHRPVEIVVIDDGSIDDTADVARRFSGVRSVHQPNRGLAAARNCGIQETHGDYLVFLDADDRLLPCAIETNLASLLAHPEWAFVSGEHRYIDIDGRVSREWTRPAVPADQYRHLLEGNYIGMCATVLYRRSVFDVAGAFDTRRRACEDYELYLRIARRFPVGHHQTTIAEYRRYGTALSDDPALMLATSIEVLRSQAGIVRRHSELEAAYARGLAYWRASYAVPLVRQIRRRWRDPSARSQTVRDALTLMRYAPGALKQLLMGGAG